MARYLSLHGVLGNWTRGNKKLGRAVIIRHSNSSNTHISRILIQTLASCGDWNQKQRGHDTFFATKIREVPTFRTLVICEKPSSATKVSVAIDEDGMPSRKLSQGVPFYECTTRLGPVTVCSALGHLYAVDTKGEITRSKYPVWDSKWKQLAETNKRSAGLARWIRVISSIAETADRFVNACDYDVEGSLIGLTLLRYACKGADVRALRMKFSTMTLEDLHVAYSKLSAKLDFSTAEAGRCRHELDWLYGINLSRSLTESALREGHGYATISAGRVQGPTLGFVITREQEIASFVPSPYWTIHASISHDGVEYHLEYSGGRISTAKGAERIVSDCQGKLLKVESIASNEVQRGPLYAFDLSTLQTESFRLFHFSPAKTLGFAERLYLEALISYPRTSSQKLPPDIDYRDILHKLSRQREYASLSNSLLADRELIPRQGVKDDSAHPAIYPTGERFARSIPTPEGRLYDLIVRRFMAAFGKPSITEVSRMVLRSGQHLFYINGSRTLDLGWKEFYSPYVSERDSDLPLLDTGANVSMKNIDALEQFEKPPPRFNSSSLVRQMESANIGTKATRAQIVDTLFKRGYIKGSLISPTDLALEVWKTLREHCPAVLDPALTSRVEHHLDEVEAGTRSARTVLIGASEEFRSVMLNLMQSEEDFGERLSTALEIQKAASSTLASPCPSCGSTLRIVKNRRTGKRFIGCNAKWEKNCNFALPLPQFGTILLSPKKCRVCGFQLVSSRYRRRKQVESCPRCYAEKAQRPSSEALSRQRRRRRAVATA